MLSGFRASVQNELDAFFAHLINQSDLLRKVSAQAFSKARQHFSADAFTLLNASWQTLVEEHFPTPRWLGLRVVAADASKMSLFLNDATARKMQEAMAFALYLPASEMTLSARLYGPSCGERQMLFEHLDLLRPDDLLVLDRGYPASWLIAVLAQRAQHFCMRVDALGFSVVRAFLRSNQDEMIVEIAAPTAQDALAYECVAKPSRVRLIRVVTPNGRVHALMTSLLDAKAFPAESFGALYHGRWRIEEAFKRLKHRLALENTSGLSWLAAQQDVGAKILADNLHAVAILAAQEENPLPLEYKINRTYAFALLKRCLPRWLLSDTPTISVLNEALCLLTQQLIRFIPLASKPRPQHPKPHRKHAYKSVY